MSGTADDRNEGEAATAKETFEAFDGQQDAFGYSQATRVADTIYVAGTVGIGEGMHIPGSMAEQMELAYRNVADTLAHFGAAMSGVVEQRVYVTSIDEASAALEVRKATGQGSAGVVDGRGQQAGTFPAEIRDGRRSPAGCLRQGLRQAHEGLEQSVTSSAVCWIGRRSVIPIR